MSHEPEDKAAGDRLGAGLLVGGFTFMSVYTGTQSAFFSLGCMVLGFLLASGRLTVLLRAIDPQVNPDLNDTESRSLEDTFVVTDKDAERYWSSYDPSKLWEQRSLELEAEARNSEVATHYGLMRERIPELKGTAMRRGATNAPILTLADPLNQFWQRYNVANARGLSWAVGQSEDLTVGADETPAKRVEEKPDYSHLPLHLALIEETKDERKKLNEGAKNATGEFGADLTQMVKNVDIIVDAIRAVPAKLGDVQRLFTYYLPEVAKLLEARQHMVTLNETDRVVEIDTILDRIEKAFAQFASRMHEADIRALDIDLKLLDQSLAAEFENQIGT